MQFNKMSQGLTNSKKEAFLCLMCNKETKKYKCSKCFEFSCSLECYKEHKENDLCLEQQHPEDMPCDSLAEEPEPTQHMFKSYDTVPPEHLSRLKTAEEVKHLLYNPHLRKLLRTLDSHPNPWRGMQDAMQEPLFVEFADACLKVVEPENDVDKK